MKIAILGRQKYISILSIVLVGCSTLKIAEDMLVLNKYSDSNYELIDNNIGKYVCVFSEIDISSIGPHIALQPIEKNDLIDVGFSRITIDFTKEYIDENSIKSGRKYAICGTIENVTPFKKCSTNLCKWYRINNSRLKK